VAYIPGDLHDWRARRRDRRRARPSRTRVLGRWQLVRQRAPEQLDRKRLGLGRTNPAYGQVLRVRNASLQDLHDTLSALLEVRTYHPVDFACAVPRRRTTRPGRGVTFFGLRLPCNIVHGLAA
jgi:hypothetical protein